VNDADSVLKLSSVDRRDDLVLGQPELLARCLVAERCALAALLFLHPARPSRLHRSTDGPSVPVPSSGGRPSSPGARRYGYCRNGGRSRRRRSRAGDGRRGAGAQGRDRRSPMPRVIPIQILGSTHCLPARIPGGEVPPYGKPEDREHQYSCQDPRDQETVLRRVARGRETKSSSEVIAVSAAQSARRSTGG